MEKEQLAHAPAWWVWLPCALEDPIPQLASSAIPEFSNKKPTCQQTSEAVLLPSPAAKHSLPHPDARAPLQPPGDRDAGAEGGTPSSAAFGALWGTPSWKLQVWKRILQAVNSVLLLHMT